MFVKPWAPAKDFKIISIYAYKQEIEFQIEIIISVPKNVKLCAPAKDSKSV